MRYTLEHARPDPSPRRWSLVAIGAIIGFLVTRFLVV